MKELPVEAVEEIKTGRKINAIKIVRETWGLGLKDSKDAVDEYCKEHPELVASLPSQENRWSKGLSWFVRLVLWVTVAYLLFQRLRA